MSTPLDKLMQIKKAVIRPDVAAEPIYLNFNNIQRRLSKLQIEDHDAWIRIYRMTEPKDLPKLTAYYIEKLVPILKDVWNIEAIVDSFSTAWQFYQPLNDTQCQTLIKKQIEKSAEDDQCGQLNAHLNKLLQGMFISSEYAKELVICILDTYIAGAKQHVSLKNKTHVAIQDIRKAEVHITDISDYDNDAVDYNIPILKLLERTTVTFEHLMRNMNNADIEFTQLLLAYLIKPEMIAEAIQLSKYVATISLLSENMCLPETIAIINNITATKPLYESNTTLPELLNE